MNDNDSNLVVTLGGPAPKAGRVNIYDLGTILISIQRLFGTVASFGLGRKETPFYLLRDRLLHRPLFIRENALQVQFRESHHGSLILDLIFGLGNLGRLEPSPSLKYRAKSCAFT